MPATALTTSTRPSCWNSGVTSSMISAPNIGELFSPPQGAQLVIGTPPGALGDPCDVRSTARTQRGKWPTCVTQGVPLAAIGSYQFPDCNRSGELGQHGPRPRAGRHSMSASFSFPAKRWAVRRCHVLRSTTSTSRSMMSSRRAEASPSFRATLQSRRREPDIFERQRVVCAYQPRPCDRTAPQCGDAVPEPGHAKDRWDRSAAPVGRPAPFLDEWPLGASTRRSAGSTITRSHHCWRRGGGLYQSRRRRGRDKCCTAARTPRWRGLTTLAYRSDLFGLGVRWRYRAS